MLYGEFFFENFYFLKHFDVIFQLYRELIKTKNLAFFSVKINRVTHSGLYMFIVMSDSELEMMN